MIDFEMNFLGFAVQKILSDYWKKQYETNHDFEFQKLSLENKPKNSVEIQKY